MALATRMVSPGHPSERIQVTAPSGGYADQQIIIVRSGATGVIGVVIGDIAAGATGTVDCGGQWELPKATGSVNAATAGDIAYFDASDNNIQKVASANVKAGIFAAAATAAATTCIVKLIPSKA